MGDYPGIDMKTDGDGGSAEFKNYEEVVLELHANVDVCKG